MVRTLAISVLAVLAGCGAAPEPVPYARAYPAHLRQARTLDIQALRQDGTLHLTNTTARAFGPGTLWLNARFSRPIEGLAVGQTLELPLGEFRDEFGDDFKPGGFFSAYLPERLVLAQLEPKGEDRMLGFVVVEAPEK